MLAAGSDQLADGVWLERNALMFPEALLLIDYAASDTERTYDWLMHFAGQLKTASDVKAVEPLANDGMYSYLTNPRSIGPGDVVFANPGLRLMQVDAGGERYITDTKLGSRKPTTSIMVRRKASKTVFVSILEPGTTKYSIKNLSVKDDRVSLDVSDGTTVWSVSAMLGDRKNKLEIKH